MSPNRENCDYDCDYCNNYWNNALKTPFNKKDKLINKMKNKKLTLWENVQFIIFVIFLSIGVTYTAMFCIRLMVDTYDYVTSLTTKDEVSYMIRNRQYELILEVEQLRYKCNQEGKYFGVSTHDNRFGFEEIICTSNKELIK